MSDATLESDTEPIGNGQLDRTLRHSLQPKSAVKLSSGNLRLTQSHRYDRDKKKKKAIIVAPIPPILEDEEDTNKSRLSYSVEKERKPSKVSKMSEISTRAAFAFDNAAYESNLDRRSISSRAGSSRASSLQSLEIVREQYCCCSRRTKCERRLLATVTVLSIVIIVLIVVIGVITTKEEIPDKLKTLPS